MTTDDAPQDDRRDPRAEGDLPPPRPPRIPRPPSQADIDRVSEAQGRITDEWAGDVAAGPDQPAEGGGGGALSRKDRSE
jgi:hypothetical protein